MEYNKDEAIRAKGMAEDKMEKKDFVGARKIALRAQQLFAGLDNISQLLTVCEVHCSAGVKVNEETDWYGILQVEPTAEDSLIKKQYRKLALLLHPDKNKFPGAEAAFKLIGEAHMTLSDEGKRSLHDLKRSSVIAIPPRQSSQQMNQTSNVKKQSVNANNAPNATARSNRRNQRQPTASTTQTFWTACMHCGMRYQYYKTILNRALRCHSCSKPYIAYDLSEEATPGANTAQYGFPSQDFPGQYAHNVGQHGNFGKPTTNMGFQGDANGRTSAPDKAARGSMDNNKVDYARSANNSTEVRFAKMEVEPPKKEEREVKPATGNASQKRSSIMVVESSDSEITDGNTERSDVEEVKYFTGTVGRYPRRSVRQKQNVECNEEKSDADSDADADADVDSSDNDDDYEVASSFVKPQVFKRLKKNGTSCDANQCGKTYSEGDVNLVKGQSNGTGMAVSDNDNNKHNTKHAHDMFPNGSESLDNNCINKETDGAKENDEILKAGTRSGVDFSSKSSPDPGTYSYPDPEFYDFDKDRGIDKFAVDQIWAVFDNLDGMPRFYARIRKVDAVNFKLRFNWLEHDPIGKAEMAWFDEDLPVSCGNFRSGKSNTTQDRMIFSHVVSCEKGTKRNTYKIYPRKGEVWALFKDWDIRWSSDADNHRTYQYEMVEVLSDYVEGSEINVIQLLKVKGFVSVFIQDPDSGNGTHKIPPDEILRFSHKVSSCRMSGNEREGILKGSLELDFASLPGNFGDIAPSISLDNTNLRVKKSFPIRVNDPDVAVCSTDLSAKGTQEQANTCRDHHTEYVNEVDILGHGQRSSKKDPATEACIHAGSQSMSHKHQVGEEMVIDARDSNAKAAARHQHVRPLEPSSPSWVQYPASEFYTFDEERSSDKFRCDQIWALYSDVDKYPKYYCWIKKVETRKFEVLVTWLECCPSNKVEAQWTKQDLPIGCGRFKLSEDEVTFDSRETFSHLVRAVPVGTREKYDIYPCIGEIWAVYRNWDVGWTCLDLENCEYDVVEIIKCTGPGLEVLLLEKVDGYRAVFKPARKDGILNSMEVLKAEYMRFSHQIPSFKLTQEWGGKLRGFWELDAASVPAGLFN